MVLLQQVNNRHIAIGFTEYVFASRKLSEATPSRDGLFSCFIPAPSKCSGESGESGETSLKPLSSLGFSFPTFSESLPKVWGISPLLGELWAFLFVLVFPHFVIFSLFWAENAARKYPVATFLAMGVHFISVLISSSNLIKNISIFLDKGTS